jgi:hypothetical protein
MIGSKQIIMFVVGSLLLAACAPATTPAPTVIPPTNIPIPTDVPTSVATPVSAFLKIPSVHCCRGQALKAGLYEVPPWLGIPLTVMVGEGWKVLNEEAALLFLIGKGRNVQNNPSQMIVFMQVAEETTPEALIASVQRAPELSATTEPLEVMIAGFPGLQLDSIAKPNPGYEGNVDEDIPPGVQFLPIFMKFFAPGFVWTTSSSEAQVRTIAITMSDHTLLLYLEAPQDEFDQFVADADPILQSLEMIEP